MDRLASLGGFFRENISTGWALSEEEEAFPFPATVRELVENAAFSCFAHGEGDNVLLEDSGLTGQELLDFMCAESPKTSGALRKLSDYMNKNAASLAERFINEPPDMVRALCAEILREAGPHSQPALPEIALFLAAINKGLMELQDYFAGEYLIQAGEALTARPL